LASDGDCGRFAARIGARWIERLLPDDLIELLNETFAFPSMPRAVKPTCRRRVSILSEGMIRSLTLTLVVALLVGCGGERESDCGGGQRETGPGTYVTVWLEPHTDEDTIRGVACELEKHRLVASVYVSPGEAEEPPRFPSLIGPLSPGAIQVTPDQSEDAGRIRAYAEGLSDNYPVADVIITRISS
jgi:hypothetical protein